MKNCVVYFSATGKTRKLAEEIKDVLDYPIYEISPLNSYTSADLNWNDKNSRTTKEFEQNLYPEFKQIDGLDTYDQLVVCFPIWWYKTPRIINSFFKKENFVNKEIVLFATSGSSGFGNIKNLIEKETNNKCKIVLGKVNPSKQEVVNFFNKK